MADTCTHLDQIQAVSPSGDGCVECLLTDGRWVHLRRCTECGHIGCCDSSPNKHASAHFHDVAHPIVQSYEPGEDWYFCYVDHLAFDLSEPGPSPSHP